jgi:hypothetical protein
MSEEKTFSQSEEKQVQIEKHLWFSHFPKVVSFLKEVPKIAYILLFVEKMQ